MAICPRIAQSVKSQHALDAAIRATLDAIVPLHHLDQVVVQAVPAIDAANQDTSLVTAQPTAARATLIQAVQAVAENATSADDLDILLAIAWSRLVVLVDTMVVVEGIARAAVVAVDLLSAFRAADSDI
jgi:hypothetical protein